MIPNPIDKVLLTLPCHEVKHLLMGGLASVFYDAVEFSRACDIGLGENTIDSYYLELIRRSNSDNVAMISSKLAGC